MSQNTRIDLNEVQRIAKLARLKLTAEEAQGLQHDMAQMLGYIEVLDSVDTDDVTPTAHAVPLTTQLRADVVQPTLSSEEALRNAPEAVGTGFGVPKIIE